MAVAIPTKIDDGDKEKWTKRLLAGLPATDRVGVNRHDYGKIIGPIATIPRRQVDDKDVDTFLKQAAAVAT